MHRPPKAIASPQRHSTSSAAARDDGGYAPSPDPKYAGNSDTGLSDLAAVTYAATLAKTMNWTLPDVGKSIEFIHRHQKPNGSFANLGGRNEGRG